MSKKLKKCPFCKNRAEMKKYTNYKAKAYYIQCGRCKTRTPSYYSKKLAMKRWNEMVKGTTVRLTMLNSPWMDFGDVLKALKENPERKFARKGWNGNGIYITLQVPDGESKMTLPYLYIVTTGLRTDNELAPKGLVPWLASQTDMLAEDWIEVVE